MRKLFHRLLGFLIIVALLYGGLRLYILFHSSRQAELRDAYRAKDASKLWRALGGNRNASSRAQWKPVPPGSEWVSATRIPLSQGLTVVTAISEYVGDFESIKHVDSIDGKGVRLTYSAEIPPPPGDDSAGHLASLEITSKRLILREDLLAAHEYMQDFSASWPDALPGTTAISVSAVVLTDLKSRGATPFAFHPMTVLTGAAAGLRSVIDLFKSARQGLLNPAADLRPKSRCTLRRAEPTDVAFPVLVNDERLMLPALHAVCRVGLADAHFYFLDDPENALALAWQLGDHGDALQVVKISFSEAAPAKQAHVPASVVLPSQRIEHQLSTERRADIYGIYFDFASDEIRPESDPVLQAIAQVLRRNPSWRLNVEGHTDNIGGDAYNQALSERRAAAVKRALLQRYQISPDRLTTVGYGATRPKDSNDTLEGRARNRRVELVRT